MSIFLQALTENMEKLTPADIRILHKEIKGRKLIHMILLGLTLVAIISFFLSRRMQWEFAISFISGFFAVALALISLIHFFQSKNVVRDLSNGVKTSAEGIITKKEMKTGYNSYKMEYSKESLEELAQYIEDKEKGLPTDNTIKGYNLAKDASSSFTITINEGSSYSVSIRDYINMNIGDKVRVEFTPLSGTCLNASKL